MFRQHRRLVQTAADLIGACPCESGCPSCVGPVGEVGEKGKEVALRVAAALLEGGPELEAGSE